MAEGNCEIKLKRREHDNKKARYRNCDTVLKSFPARTYSPTRSPEQYHRRWRA